MADIKLRPSMFGYKKDDVHTYIQEMSENAAKEVKKIEDELKAAKDEIKKNDESNNAVVSAKNQEIANIKALLAEKQKEIENTQNIINKLTAEKEEYVRIIKGFDNERAAISSALITAQQNANNIIKDAKTQAADVMQKLSIEKEEQMRIAAIDMQNAKNEINKTAKELVTLKEQVVSAMQKYKSELEYILSEYKV